MTGKSLQTTLDDDEYLVAAVNRYLPSGAVLSRRMAVAVDAQLRGATVPDIASKTGVSEETVCKWRGREDYREALMVNARAAFREVDLEPGAVLRELWAIVQVTMQDLVDEEGKPIPLHLLPRHVAGAVREWDVTITEDTLPDGTVRVTRTGKAKLLSRQAAIERLGDYLSLWSGQANEAGSRMPAQFIIEGKGGEDHGEDDLG